ncbi:MAG: alpha/beta fold hydrolase [Candidatus Caccovivens sp.]
MKYFYRDTEIFYKFINRKSEVTNVFLHGWGCDHTSFLFSVDKLKDNCLFVDFPPHGQSKKPSRDWTVFTYANMLISLCQHLGIKKYNLIGHSFGGRIAIIVAVLCKKETIKLVLVDSAGLKPKRSLNYYRKIYAYKIRKKLGLNVSKYGSCDYLALDDGMRKVFNSIVNTHLEEFLPYITAKTMIIFGKNDDVTPIYMAKKLHKKIKNSSLVILEDAGHFSFVDRRYEFLAQIVPFLNE